MEKEQRDLLYFYQEMKRVKAIMDTDNLKNEDKESIITAFSKAVDAAFGRLQKIVEEMELAERQEER